MTILKEDKILSKYEAKYTCQSCDEEITLSSITTEINPATSNTTITSECPHCKDGLDVEERAIALAEHLEVNYEEVEVSSYEETRFDADGGEYSVLTDDEADVEWEAALDNYLEECIYPELSGDLSNYFDDEKWKDDARYDGRGHSLSGYDGNEEQCGEYYIYRTN